MGESVFFFLLVGVLFSYRRGFLFFRVLVLGFLKFRVYLGQCGIELKFYRYLWIVDQDFRRGYFVFYQYFRLFSFFLNICQFVYRGERRFSGGGSCFEGRSCCSGFCCSWIILWIFFQQVIFYFDLQDLWVLIQVNWFIIWFYYLYCFICYSRVVGG